MKRERAVWRISLLVLGTLALGFAIVSWETLRQGTQHLQALPIGLMVLVTLFGALAWKKSREISEFRELVRRIDKKTPGQDAQLDQLFSLISKSQQGYRDLIDTFEDLLFSVSLDGRILTANRSFADLLGQSFADVIGRSIHEFFEFPGQPGEQTQERIIAQFTDRRRWTGVVCVRLKSSGATHYLDCVLHSIVRDNVVQGVSGLARDITRERENETRFTELFQTLREGVYLSTSEDRISEVNPALAQMLGFSGREELLGLQLGSMYKNTSDRVAERDKLDASGFLRARETTLVNRQTGREVVVLHTTTVIRDPAGKFVRYQGTFVDITEQRDMERLLHREQEFARRLMDAFPDIVVALDSDARYTFASPQMFDALGYKPEELIGQKLGGRSDSHGRSELMRLFHDLFSGSREEGQIEYRAQHKNGTWRLFRASARALRDEKGYPIGIIASARDITDQQKMEQHLIQSERLAAMGQMIAGVAHELNNPLTAILGVTELMRDAVADEASRRQLELAHRQARRAAHIVQSLLEFSRPSTPRNTRLHISDLLQRTLQLHEHSLRVNHIQVDIVPRPELPAVLGDSNQLTQVFLNLIVNAEQAIHEIRDHGTLRIRLGVVNERVVITFQDDGVGIRRETLPRIFDPFFTTKRPGRGTGLGLSICMAIIREHNGDISGQPQPEGGAVFTVSLPICTEPVVVMEKPVVSTVQSGKPATETGPLLGKRLLLIDDEESIRELVSNSLGSRGLAVDCAATSDEAMDLATRNNYELILCDLHLQSAGAAVSGVDLCHCLRESQIKHFEAHPVILFMSGDLAHAEIQGFPGVTRFLQKPFRIADLIGVLNEAICATAPQSPNLAS